MAGGNAGLASSIKQIIGRVANKGVVVSWGQKTVFVWKARECLIEAPRNLCCVAWAQ